MTNAIVDAHILQWRTDIDRVSSDKGTGRYKLRTYNLLKTNYKLKRIVNYNYHTHIDLR
jgi:hypothetical protein